MEGEFFSHRGMSIEGGHAMVRTALCVTLKVCDLVVSCIRSCLLATMTRS